MTINADEAQTKVANAIRKIRTKRLGQQDRFAEQLMVTQAQVSRIENGCCAFKLVNLVDICNALGITLSTLMKEAGL